MCRCLSRPSRPCIALGTEPCGGEGGGGGGYTKGKSLGFYSFFEHAYLFLFCINKRGDAWHFFFCVFMFDESRLYKILLFPFLFGGWGGEGTRSMMPREARCPDLFEEKPEL